MKKLSLLMLCSLMFLPQLAAQDEDRLSKGYIGWRVGYHELDKSADDDQGIVGFFGGMYLNGFLSFEASIDHKYGGHVSYTENDGDYDFDVDFDEEYLALQLGIKASLIPRGPVRPFVTGGIAHYESENYRVFNDNVAVRDSLDQSGTYLGCGIDFFKWRNRSKGVSLTWENRWNFADKDEVGGIIISNEGFMSTIGIKWNL